MSPFFKTLLGVPPLGKGAYLEKRLYAPFPTAVVLSVLQGKIAPITHARTATSVEITTFLNPTGF